MSTVKFQFLERWPAWLIQL